MAATGAAAFFGRRSGLGDGTNMAVPKRRKSKSKTRKGRSHQAMTAPPVVYCPNCGSASLPHRICPNCGQYSGRQIVAQPEAEAK